MPTYMQADDVPVGTIDMETTNFATRLIHGLSASLMLAERPAGYHSEPHRHDCEQLNMMHSGELYIYTTDRAYRLRAGDVLRIPANVVHWSWNRSDEPCTLIEVHAPGIQNDPLFEGVAVGLFDDGAPAAAEAGPRNEFVHLDRSMIDEVESMPPVRS